MKDKKLLEEALNNVIENAVHFLVEHDGTHDDDLLSEVKEWTEYFKKEENYIYLLNALTSKIK